MLVLAVDTATPGIVAGVVRLHADGAPESLAAEAVRSPRGHGELLAPQLRRCLRQAGLGMRDLEAVVVGAGPGPFTGLRVGMVTGATLGHALDIPVHPVCTLDAVAATALQQCGRPAPILVVTDARRRELYWAPYGAAGNRLQAPQVSAPSAIADLLQQTDRAGQPIAWAAGEGARLHATTLGLPQRGISVCDIESPRPEVMVGLLAGALGRGACPEPLHPLYLRRPDAQVPHAPKSVNSG